MRHAWMYGSAITNHVDTYLAPGEALSGPRDIVPVTFDPGTSRFKPHCGSVDLTTVVIRQISLFG